MVSVSIDRDRKAIEDFVEREKLPWTILLDLNEARGTDKSLATYYGIFTIPQMILVGKDGKVLALNVRGPAAWQEAGGTAGAGGHREGLAVGRIWNKSVTATRDETGEIVRPEGERKMMEKKMKVAGRLRNYLKSRGVWSSAAKTHQFPIANGGSSLRSTTPYMRRPPVLR